MKNRKQQRKEKRKLKKVKKNEYYTNRKKPGQYVLNPNKHVEENVENLPKKKSGGENNVLSTEAIRKKEQKEQKRIQKEMDNQRKKQLLKENITEDRTIKRLEKLLHLNKRKTKNLPKSFAFDGLDYLLEVCDPEMMKKSVAAEQELNDINNAFDEDFALMTDKSTTKKQQTEADDPESDDEMMDLLNEDDDSEEEILDEIEEDSNESDIEEENNGKRKFEDDDFEVDKKIKPNSDSEELSEEENKDKDGVWSDIYGRLRTKDGGFVENEEKTQQKYVPPAIRAQMESSSRTEKLNRLKKQLKGLLNRLAESNMHNISNQIENLYMNNSRNDMNDTLTNLMMESLVTNVVTPERLLMEHVMLISILHANVGSEIGAHFLQTTIKKFHNHLNENVENKSLDNVVNILAQLYNFHLFDAKLMYDVLKKLSENFDEKNVECILHILRTVGFNLRKDDPIKLKTLIFDLQKLANSADDSFKDNSRLKFMLDILLAIKNNNVTKIPNYDTTYSEHLKKISKNFIRKGNYVTQLNISLEDLLNADERGKWWIVGSAWTGKSSNNNVEETKKTSKEDFSEKLLELARAQRMNTDTRRNIFCIIMSAEDYMDAFEKLLRLGLKNQQEREIIHVLLHCCLQEKQYNPYYGILAQKFCDYDRKYQMTIKCSVWDKLKALKEHSTMQLSNLAKLLTHLFIEKALPISTLKIVEFSELDKITLRFMRQILLGVLLNENLVACQEVFINVSQSDKLKMFRESLRLFIHHFLLRNLNTNLINDKQKLLLEERARIVEKILSNK